MPGGDPPVRRQQPAAGNRGQIPPKHGKMINRLAHHMFLICSQVRLDLSRVKRAGNQGKMGLSTSGLRSQGQSQSVSPAARICIGQGITANDWQTRSKASKGRSMEYFLDVQDSAMIVRVNGRVDESSWEEFGAGLSEAVRQAAQAGLAHVAIDLSQLDYMSSRGLRVLTVAKREADDCAIAISLASPNAVMREILAISRYDKLFAITDTLEMKP
jgi:anti-anti-sigma factor